MGYVKSELNCSDDFTKPVGKNIYNSHIDMNTGRGKPVPSIKRLRTIESDALECPRCTCLIPPAKKHKKENRTTSNNNSTEDSDEEEC
jgi:hypothetical protein